MVQVTNADVLQNDDEWVFSKWNAPYEKKNSKSLHSTIKRFKEEYKKKKKNVNKLGGKEKLDDYLQQPFQFPVPLDTPHAKRHCTDIGDSHALQALCVEQQQQLDQLAELEKKYEHSLDNIHELRRRLRNAMDRERYTNKKLRKLETCINLQEVPEICNHTQETDEDEDEKNLHIDIPGK